MTWPAAVQFDPAGATASSAIQALLEGAASAAPVLLLAVGPIAQRRSWAGQTAIKLADTFAARGAKVILADLSLQNPELHSLLGTDNEEGLTDVFLFGASLQHITTSIAGRSFRLIPASAFTPEPRAVLAHERWSGLFEELAQSRDQLIVYLPMELPGAAELADRIGRAVVLGAPSDLWLIQNALPDDADVASVITPPEPTPEAGIGIETEERQAGEPSHAGTTGPAIERLDDVAFEQIRIPRDGARESLIAELRARQRAALMGPPPPLRPLAHEPVEAAASPVTPATRVPAVTADGLDMPPPVAPRPRPRPGRPRLVWVVVLVAIGIMLAAAVYVWQLRFAAVRQPPLDQADSTAQPAAAQPAGDRTANVSLPFSVAVASYGDLSLAEERLTQLGRQQPRLPFYISPVEVEGVMFFTVFAGPLADSSAAVGLRDTLIAKRIKTISTGREILAAPFAFLLGEYAQRGDAEEQQQAAAMKGVPSYIVASTGLDGSPQYSLYAGAYTGPGEAEFMRQVLRSVGLPDNLVERTGTERS